METVSLNLKNGRSSVFYVFVIKQYLIVISRVYLRSTLPDLGFIRLNIWSDYIIKTIFIAGLYYILIQR